METQALNQEMLEVKENITFTPLEWKYFVLELKEMIAKGEFNIAKVIHNARYFAELERSENEIKAGHYVKFTEEEWEKFINEQTV